MTATVPALLAGQVTLATMTEVYDSVATHLNALDVRDPTERTALGAALPKLDEFAGCIKLLTDTQSYMLPNDVREHIRTVATELFEVLV